MVFALLMQLLQAGEPQSLRLSFGSSSLFLLWVGLGSAGLLCALRSALVRLRFGPIALGELKIGNWREATEREIAALRVILKKAGGETEASADE